MRVLKMDLLGAPAVGDLVEHHLVPPIQAMPRPSSSICVAKTAVTASLLAPVYAKEERLVEVELALPTGWGPGLRCGGRVPCGGVKVRELVQTIDIGLGAGFDDIGGSATPHDLAASFFELHGDLSQGFGAAGYTMNLIPLELGGGVGDLRNGPANRVHGTVSDGGAFLRGALHAHSHRRGGNGRRAAVDMQVQEFKGGRQGVDLVMQDGHEILVEHL